MRLSESIGYINAYTFENCESLRVLDIPQSVSGFGEGVFRWTHIDALVVRGTFSGNLRYDTFYFVSDSMIVYAQTSEIPKFKRVFSGTVLPLEDYDTSVPFTEGQMATIILPTTPDASKGKYYRLDRCEDEKIIFEEELNPKARTPYIIVPNEDFSIDLSMLDLTGLSQDTVSIQGIDFIGSYTSEELDDQEGFYIDIIDTTPDCSLSPSVETEKGAFLIGALRAYLQVNKTLGQPLFVTLLPPKTNPSYNLAEAKQKLASLYKYSNKYEDKLKGNEGWSFFFCDISNPDSLADVNMEADLKKYIMLVGQGQTGELSIPRELYNPDIEVEIDYNSFFCTSNTNKNYKVGDSRNISFNNTQYSDIADKYGHVSCNDFYYLSGPGAAHGPHVEIKLQGNLPSTYPVVPEENTAEVMSGLYDIGIVMVPDWYRRISSEGGIDSLFYDQAYVDSLSSISRMSFVTQISYTNNAENGRDQVTKMTSVFEYDGTKVDTLWVYKDFEFPYSYANITKSYPTLIIQSSTSSSDIRRGYVRELCIDKIILRSKEDGSETYYAPQTNRQTR